METFQELVFMLSLFPFFFFFFRYLEWMLLMHKAWYFTKYVAFMEQSLLKQFAS